MTFLLPMLKADFSMSQEYIYQTKDKLDIPFVCFVGKQDALVLHGSQEWSQHTTKNFSIYTIEGGHFFHQENPTELLSLIAKELAQFM